MNRSFRLGFGASFVVGSMAMSIASGCGTRIGGTGLPSPAPTALPSVAPSVPVIPTPVPTPTPAPLQQAIAVVSSMTETGGSWYCFFACHKKVDAQISITNNNAYPVVAAVTVTFTDGGQPAGTMDRTLQLPADNIVTFDASASQTSDNATVMVTNTTPAGSVGTIPSIVAPAYGAPIGYGTTPAYGSTMPSGGTNASSGY